MLADVVPRSASSDSSEFMRPFRFITIATLCLSGVAFTTSCGKKPETSTTAAGHSAPHEHVAPNGGTPVVLGDEASHLELVLDAKTGTLKAFVLDGEMEDFIRLNTPSFEVVATVRGEKQVLVFQAVADPATGEKIGDTSLFEASAEWLKTVREFDAVLTTVTIRGTTFAGVHFNFPRGNERPNDRRVDTK